MIRTEGEDRQGEGRRQEEEEEEEEEPSSCFRFLKYLYWLWVAYFTTLEVLLKVTLLLGLVPQILRIPYLSSAGLQAKLLLLVERPLTVSFLALRVQVLWGMAKEADGGFPRLRANLMALRLPSEAAGAVEKGVAVLFLFCMAYGFGKGFEWDESGRSWGLPSGFILGSLSSFNALAWFEIIVEFVVRVASVGAPMQPPLDLEATKGMPSEREPMIAAAASGDGRGHDAGGRSEMLVGAAWLVYTVLLQLCVALLAWKFNVRSFIPNATLPIAFLTMGYGLSQLFNGLVERRSSTVCPRTSPFWIVILLFTIMCPLVQVVPHIIDELQSSETAKLTTPLLSPSRGAWTPAWPSYPQPTFLTYDTHMSHRLEIGKYPVCHNMQWGDLSDDPRRNLQVLDIIAFAQAVYWDERADVMSEVRNATSGTDLGEVVLESLEEPDKIGRVGVFALPQVRARVMAIRGSLKADDWAYNLDLWGPALLFNSLKLFMPFIEFFPKELVSYLVPLDLGKMDDLPQGWYCAEEAEEIAMGRVLCRYREAVRRSLEDGFSFVVTGHSLGGGLAQFVGKFTPTVVFSPVGISFSKQRTWAGAWDDFIKDDFVKEPMVESAVVAVKPYGDLVSMIDDQTGLVQNIMCTARNPLSCHSLSRTACELFRKCGDPRGRSMESMCSKTVGYDWRARPWRGFAWTS